MSKPAAWMWTALVKSHLTGMRSTIQFPSFFDPDEESRIKVYIEQVYQCDLLKIKGEPDPLFYKSGVR